MPRIIFRLLLIIAALALVASSALAQQIQGTVRYAQNRQPVLGAPVICDGTGGRSQQMTDRNGKFYFRVSPGHYTCSVRIPGYVEAQHSVDLTDTKSSEYVDLLLKDDGSGRAAANTTNSTPDADANAPANAREEFNKGSALVGEGKKEKLEEGVTHLEKAISLYPKYLSANLMLGTTYMDLQQWDKAEKALHRALEINPKAANAYLALGEIYWHQKKYAEAEKTLQDGLAIEGRSYQGHFTLARVYWDEANATKDEAQVKPAMEKSYTEVNQALSLKSDLADAHLLKGNLLLRVRRAQDALTEFEEYLRLEPKGKFAEPTKALVEKIKKALAEQKK